MKRSMKKLAVFVLIAAIAIFVAAGTASAWDHDWKKAIEGEYAVTGFNECLLAPFGFDQYFQPNPAPGGTTPVTAPGGTQSWEGVYTFEANGTGELNMVDHNIGGLFPGGGSASIYWKFNYSVTHGGKITFTMVKGSYLGQWLTGALASPPMSTPVKFYADTTGPWYGFIAPDGKTLVVTWGALLSLTDSAGNTPPPSPTPPNAQLICNGSFVGIWLHE